MLVHFEWWCVTGWLGAFQQLPRYVFWDCGFRDGEVGSAEELRCGSLFDDKDRDGKRRMLGLNSSQVCILLALIAKVTPSGT